MKKALLIVASPFQLMNVVSALSYFNVEEYELFILKDSSSSRHNQIVCLARYYHMKYCLVDYYKEIHVKKRDFLKKYVKSFFKVDDGEFDIIISGDYRHVDSVFTFFLRLKKDGKICFVDDGNATIAIFQGKDVSDYTKCLYSLLKFLMRFKTPYPFYYFTIYDDLKTNKFSVISNKLQNLCESNASDEIIYVLGTNTVVYTKYHDIPIEEFHDKVSDVLTKIKNKHTNKRIVFIPHGREMSRMTTNICKELSIEYFPLEECVEAYFVKQKKWPEYVYAFGSSALLNLKKMFPQSICTNIFIKGNVKAHNEIYDDINAYYLKHDLPLITIV